MIYFEPPQLPSLDLVAAPQPASPDLPVAPQVASVDLGELGARFTGLLVWVVVLADADLVGCTVLFSAAA